MIDICTAGAVISDAYVPTHLSTDQRVTCVATTPATTYQYLTSDDLSHIISLYTAPVRHPTAGEEEVFSKALMNSVQIVDEGFLVE